MKKLLMLLFAGSCGLVWAQTNTPPSAKPDADKAATVDAESATFDMGTRELVYTGRVRVRDPKLKLDCERLLLDLPEAGGHLKHITAVTNVVIDFVGESNQTYHVTSVRADYDFKIVDHVTNELVTFTGNPIVTTKDGNVLHSEPLIWDRQAKRFDFSHITMTLPNGLGGGNTNGASSPMKLY